MPSYTLHTELGDSDLDGQPATPAQIEASFAEVTGSGVIRIDADGDVIASGSYGFADTIRVWVA